MTIRFEEVWAALLARDNLHPPDLRDRMKAEFLHGAAAAFAACWRGEESERCRNEAQSLYDPPSD